MDGRFSGNAVFIDLEVSSPLIAAARKILPVKIDTGCSSDLILTYTEAFPLALTLVGIQEYTIADGSKVRFFECLGNVKYGNKEVISVISIRPQGSLLLGVTLLEKLGIELKIDFVNHTVKLEPATAIPTAAPTPTGSPTPAPTPAPAPRPVHP